METQMDTQMDTEKGIYIFEDTDDNEICLFIYVKLSDKAMSLALQKSDDDVKGSYFIAILKKGMDYLGRTEFSGIEMINSNEVLVSLDKEYDEIQYLINITEEEFESYVKFGNEKLNALRDLESKQD